MKFNSIGATSNYAQAGKAAADELVKIHAAARANAPDMGGIVTNAANRKSKEKIAATKAMTEVARTGITVQGKVQADKIVKTATRDRDQAKRKAGALAVAGKMFSSAGSYMGEKRTKREVGSEDSWYDSQIDRTKNNYQEYRDLLSTNNDTPGASTSTPDDSSVPTPSGNNSTDGKPISSYQATGKKGKFSVGDMTRLAEGAGFTPEQARVMGAIGFAESGGRAGVDTSMTIDPGKKNEYSIGLFQVNAQAHGDKLRKLGYTEDDLRDPQKAAQVAKMVYDEVGSFKPWSVYKSGAYADYLQ